MEEVLLALSGIYGSNYPLSDRVRTGLIGVLNKEYDGSEEAFKDKFVHPTITLLGSLKEKSFPLCMNEKQNPDRKMIVLHLVQPLDKLQNGEFYFQAGHTNPGKLALKFAKYQANKEVSTQPSTVEEDDYDCAFSPDFFTHLRQRNSLGDVMFRTLIVLPDGSDGVERLQAKDYLRICPEERRGRFRTDSHVSIEESCEEKESKLVRMPSENDGESS